MLEVLGLSGAEEAAYSWLLERGAVSEDEFIKQVAQETRGDDGSCHELIAVLVSEGLVSRLPGSPGQVIATAPEVTLERLALSREEELHQARRAIVEMQDRYRLAVGSQSSHDLVEILHGRDANIARAKFVIASTRTEFLGFDAPPHYGCMTAPDPQQLHLLDQGIRCRTIYDSRSLQVPGYLEVVEELASAGEEARVIDRTPIKLAISDREFALVPMQSDVTKPAGTLFVRRCGLLDALAELFESIWERAVPLNLTAGSAAGRVSDDRLGDDDRRLLAMLASGLSDDSIGRALGISHRTMQRRLHRLQQRLYAPTRFQLAVQACRHGWI